MNKNAKSPHRTKDSGKKDGTEECSKKGEAKKHRKCKRIRRSHQGEDQMIDYLTPFERVMFGGIIALEILAMLSPEGTTQMIGTILLTVGLWGGVIALIRGLLHREPGLLYLSSFVGALIAGLMKFFVFPDFGRDGKSNVIWAFIAGTGIASVAGTELNALTRKPPEEPGNTLETPSQAAEAPLEIQLVPLPGKGTDDTIASSDSESS